MTAWQEHKTCRVSFPPVEVQHIYNVKRKRKFLNIHNCSNFNSSVSPNSCYVSLNKQYPVPVKGEKTISKHFPITVLLPSLCAPICALRKIRGQVKPKHHIQVSAPWQRHGKSGNFCTSHSRYCNTLENQWSSIQIIKKNQKNELDELFMLKNYEKTALPANDTVSARKQDNINLSLEANPA